MKKAPIFNGGEDLSNLKPQVQDKVSAKYNKEAVKPKKEKKTAKVMPMWPFDGDVSVFEEKDKQQEGKRTMNILVSDDLFADIGEHVQAVRSDKRTWVLNALIQQIKREKKYF